MPLVARSNNLLLARMSQADYARLTGRAEPVTVPLHEVVCEPGEPMRHAHFPIDCVFSAVVLMKDGSPAEAATIGNEGFIGLALRIDERASLHRIVQQVEGESLRVPAADFKAAVGESQPLRRLLERYWRTATHQAGRNAACNLRHSLGQRLCRWLLTTHHRVPGNEFRLTQEGAADMLGVRRQSVTDVARPLMDAGLIRYSRGKITILDRPGLEAASCECYEAYRQTYERIMKTGE